MTIYIIKNNKHGKIVSAYKKHTMKDKNSIKSEDYQTEIFKFLVRNMNKYRTNEQGVFFMLIHLEFDVLYKLHDISLDYYCSKIYSADLVSEIVINENKNDFVRQCP